MSDYNASEQLSNCARRERPAQKTVVLSSLMVQLVKTERFVLMLALGVPQNDKMSVLRLSTQVCSHDATSNDTYFLSPHAQA